MSHNIFLCYAVALKDRLLKLQGEAVAGSTDRPTNPQPPAAHQLFYHTLLSSWLFSAWSIYIYMAIYIETSLNLCTYQCLGSLYKAITNLNVWLRLKYKISMHIKFKKLALIILNFWKMQNILLQEYNFKLAYLHWLYFLLAALSPDYNNSSCIFLWYVLLVFAKFVRKIAR